MASFYRAAAVALSEARAPGDVLDTLTLVRGVALRDDEDDASRGASRRAGEASPPPVEGSLAALAAAARRSDPAFAWSGFEPCGEEMCHAVVATWLPCLTAAQRASLHDEILRASPPAIAARVLVPALAPSRNPSGRRLDHVGQLAVAAEAARALARALDRGLAADIVASAATSVSADDSDDSADDARDALRALLSAADRCELPPGAHPDARRLHPRVFARDVAEQILRAGAEAARAAERSTTTTDSRADDSASFAKDSTAAAAADVAAFAVGVACRRGDADAVADALIALLLDAPSTKETDPAPVCKRFGGVSSARDPETRSTSTSADSPRLPTASPYPLGLVVARVPDAHAVERLCGAVVRASSRRGLTWRAAERCVREAFSRRFWACPTTRRALCDGLLLRRAAPRDVLPAIVRVAIVAPPKPPHSAEASAAPDLDPDLDVATSILDAHRSSTLAATVDAWSDPALIRAGSDALRGHVASVVAAALAATEPNAWRRGGGEGGGGLAAGLAGAAGLSEGGCEFGRCSMRRGRWAQV